LAAEFVLSSHRPSGTLGSASFEITINLVVKPTHGARGQYDGRWE
jgi:hypothetical protein